jgi:hypothetical protein
VILPGANVDEASVPAPTAWDVALSALRLGLVGIDWERKGGPVPLDVATELQRRGHPAEVVGIRQASKLPSHPAPHTLGFMDQGARAVAFPRPRPLFHFGCLLSSIEASGICRSSACSMLPTRIAILSRSMPMSRYRPREQDNRAAPAQDAAGRVHPEDRSSSS